MGNAPRLSAVQKESVKQLLAEGWTTVEIIALFEEAYRIGLSQPAITWYKKKYAGDIEQRRQVWLANFTEIAHVHKKHRLLQIDKAIRRMDKLLEKRNDMTTAEQLQVERTLTALRQEIREEVGVRAQPGPTVSVNVGGDSPQRIEMRWGGGETPPALEAPAIVVEAEVVEDSGGNSGEA